MKILTKSFIVIYDDNKNIIIRQTENKETYVGKGSKYAEFDSEDELNQFIVDNKLVEVELN